MLHACLRDLVQGRKAVDQQVVSVERISRQIMGVIVGAACCTGAVQADALGIEAGIGSWQMDPAGYLNYRGDNVDVDDDLHLSDSANAFVWFAFEHPVPVLPNLKLAYTRVESDGAGRVSRSFDFGSITVNISDQISSSFEMDEADLILYYELLDSAVSLDVGLDVKVVDGEASIVSSAGRDSAEFTGAIPLLYARADVALPLTGLSVGVEGAALTYSGSRITDLTARLRYTFGAGFALEGGWKQQELVLDDVDDVDTDIDLKGPYVAAVLDF